MSGDVGLLWSFVPQEAQKPPPALSSLPQAEQIRGTIYPPAGEHESKHQHAVSEFDSARGITSAWGTDSNINKMLIFESVPILLDDLSLLIYNKRVIKK